MAFVQGLLCMPVLVVGGANVDWLQTAAVLSLFKRFWSTSRLNLYRWLKKLIAIVILKSFPQVSISWMGSSTTGRTANSSNETEVGPKESWNWNKAVAKFSLNWRCLEGSEPGIIIQHTSNTIEYILWRSISKLGYGTYPFYPPVNWCTPRCWRKRHVWRKVRCLSGIAGFFYLQEETI